MTMWLRPDEIIVDSFAGGGGASLGIEMALGSGPDIAINHDPEAIALHSANHSRTEHYCESVWEVDPRAACRGRPVGLAWFSPDCKHFSKAKGGKPVSKQIRALAWVVVRWARAVRPRVIALENVEEFATWGPVGPDGRPRAECKGDTFRLFVRRLERLGYVVQWRELRACDYGAPTSRKRLFLVARCDGQPIVWPNATHGKGRALPWRTAAECIDWSLPCPSIFLTQEEGRAIGVRRPLAEATMRRIARGIRRYVLDAAQPFIVPLTHQGGARAHGIESPLCTITGAHRGELALVAPYLVPRYGERDGQEPRAMAADRPMPTIVPTQNGAQLVAAFLAKHYGGHETPGAPLEFPLPTATATDHHALVTAHLEALYSAKGGESRGADVREPLRTVTASDRHALVSSHLVKLHGTTRDGQALTEPCATILAQGTHLAEVRAFLTAYYGSEGDRGGDLFAPMRTVTARDRLGLVAVHGADYVIVDIGMRMLSPRELYRAQGFPDTYRIETEYRGKPLTKTAQVRMCGNSVSPPVAAAIVAANLGAANVERVA